LALLVGCPLSLMPTSWEVATAPYVNNGTDVPKKQGKAEDYGSNGYAVLCKKSTGGWPEPGLTELLSATEDCVQITQSY
jgi:hypothetical protein